MRTARRAGTERLVHRIAELVALTAGRPVPRQRLAARWAVTPRTVNNVIDRAFDLFGVRVEHLPSEGYALITPGILDLKACVKATR
jgi:hypothetical protein